MRSDNLQLPCAQPPISSCNFHGRHSHGGHGGQNRTGRDGTGRDQTGRDQTGRDQTGQDQTGRDRTGRDGHLNLTFQVSCDLQLSQLLRCL